MTSGADHDKQATSLAAAIQQVREEHAAGRQRIRELHDRGLDGLQVSGRLTSLLDAIISKLFAAAEDELGAAAPANLRSRLALAALGSYGRRHSSPYSDVDLMILHDGLEPAALTSIVRPFTNAIYDAGMQLGHSVRTPLEAVTLSRDDAVICSSLIDCRLVAGAQPLFEDFRMQFERMVRKRAKLACRAFYDARREERDQYGQSLYLLEPHVKRSRGGLRDLHLLRWVGFAQYGQSDPDLLHLAGGMSKFDHHRLLNAQSFLLRLRNEMHFFGGASRDLLDRAEQLRLAELFGYRGGSGLLPVERFMRDYFHHANHLWQMVRRREATLETESTFGKILDPVFSRTIEGNYRVGVRQISATRPGLAALKGDLAEVMRLIEISTLEGKPLDSPTTSALVLAAPDYSDAMTPEIADRLMRILATPISSGMTMRTLHELGYLEKIIPAFYHAKSLLQFNQYHKYTVDEHSLAAVEIAGSFAKRTDGLGAAYRAIQDKALLHLALLLHDLGKGFEEDHSEIGRRIAVETAARLGLDERRTATLAFLVHQHLAMNHLAFRRDITDQQLVRSLAASVEDAERLRMLFVVSCADMAAVGPDVLTSWKVDLLRDLYSRTLAILGDAEDAAPLAAAARREDVYAQLSPQEKADPWFRAQLETLPASVLATHEPKESAAILERLRRLPAKGGRAWGVAQPESQTVEFIAGVDQGHGRGLFAAMAGVLSSCGLQIIAADTQVMADGLLLLRYVATDPDYNQASSQYRLDDVSRQLVASIDATEPPKFRRVWGQEQAEAAVKLTAMPNEVRIDNRSSSKATVVEVFTFDRVGLLYELAHKLHELDLTIWHAKIATYLDQVVDVFYVSPREGGKVEDADRIATIKEALFGVIGGEAAESDRT